jgi:tripartite-type tricarboxylate transporter receptor subunit TctC
MNKEMAAVLANPNVRDQMMKQGFTPKSSTPEEAAAFIKGQVPVWRDVLRTTGIEAQ